MDEKRMKQMNKALVILLVPLVAATAIAIFVIVRFPGLHDNANDIRERLWQVESVDKQLEQLELLAKKYGDALPWTQWDTMHWEGTSIILRPAAELPEDLVPDLEGAEPTDALPEEVRGAKLLALYQHRLPRNRYLLGDFQMLTYWTACAIRWIRMRPTQGARPRTPKFRRCLSCLPWWRTCPSEGWAASREAQACVRSCCLCR